MYAVSQTDWVWDAEDSSYRNSLPRVMAEVLFCVIATHKIQFIIRVSY